MTRRGPILRVAAPVLGAPGATTLRFLRLVAIWYAIGSVLPGLAIMAAGAVR